MFICGQGATPSLTPREMLPCRHKSECARGRLSLTPWAICSARRATVESVPNERRAGERNFDSVTYLSNDSTVGFELQWHAIIR